MNSHSVISERCGRRNGLILNGAVNVVGAVLELLAKPTRYTVVTPRGVPIRKCRLSKIALRVRK